MGRSHKPLLNNILFKHIHLLLKKCHSDMLYVKLLFLFSQDRTGRWWEGRAVVAAVVAQLLATTHAATSQQFSGTALVYGGHQARLFR
jgi:hypothetical protein